MCHEKNNYSVRKAVDKSENWISKCASKFFDDTCILYLAWSGVNKTTREMWCIEFPFKYQVN